MRLAGRPRVVGREVYPRNRKGLFRAFPCSRLHGSAPARPRACVTPTRYAGWAPVFGQRAPQRVRALPVPVCGRPGSCAGFRRRGSPPRALHCGALHHARAPLGARAAGSGGAAGSGPARWRCARSVARDMVKGGLARRHDRPGLAGRGATGLLACAIRASPGVGTGTPSRPSTGHARVRSPLHLPASHARLRLTLPMRTGPRTAVVRSWRTP